VFGVRARGNPTGYFGDPAYVPAAGRQKNFFDVFYTRNDQNSLVVIHPKVHTEYFIGGSEILVFGFCIF
jgi:hypothetical protein